MKRWPRCIEPLSRRLALDGSARQRMAKEAARTPAAEMNRGGEGCQGFRDSQGSDDDAVGIGPVRTLGRFGTASGE